MSEPAREPQVVAGFDGSDHARLAVSWAAGEAASRGCDLTVVEVVDWPVTGTLPPTAMAMPPGGSLLEERTLRDHAERRLADVEREVQQARPEVRVGTRVEFGRAAEALARVAGATDLVVIGSSGRSALPRMLLGSTAATLVHTCDRPIVVVRNGKDLPARGGRVVVGVDGSPTSRRAIGFAFDFAARHGCELVAVHAWTDLPMDALEPVRLWDEDTSGVRRDAERLLAESLSGHEERYPRVAVHRVVSFDRPAHAVMEQAEGAALLVVGSHGRGAVRGVLLGSVSHAVIYHAPCPVAVLRGHA
jgi:nucleotide-binding universal stress UspA family protein